MGVPGGFFTIWLAVTVLPVLALIAIGLSRIGMARRVRSVPDRKARLPCTEILIPVKGVFPHQEAALRSMLEQNHPCYGLIFILDRDDDPANALVEELCSHYLHARKVVAGLSTSCCQKNHNLIEGMRHLTPETEIVVFCDASNCAERDWLVRFTGPLCSGDAQVVTTFRTFDPRPRTIAGVCQAIYASFVLILDMVKPKTWGGATAILRTTFERLDVIGAWSGTVVDDLILTNVLDRAGVKIRVCPEHLLCSPLRNQTVRGFLGYLDRQILFPKFTNPVIWAASVVTHLSLTLALTAVLPVGLAFLFGLVGQAAGWVTCGVIVGCLAAVLLLRMLNPFSIPMSSWLLAFFPCMYLASYIFVRSLFINYIDWHGRRYWCGRGGKVVRIG